MTTSFAKLLAALVRADVQFVTVGGVACVLNGHLRGTQDVDILIEAEPSNIERLLEVLRNWGEGYARELTAADFPIEPGAVRVYEEFPLDIFTEMSGLTWPAVTAHLRWWHSAELAVPFLDAPALIWTKEHSVRPKDQEDVRVLRHLASLPAA